MEQKRYQPSLDSETASASEGSDSNMGFVTNFMESPLMVLVTIAFLPEYTHMSHFEQ